MCLSGVINQVVISILEDAISNKEMMLNFQAKKNNFIKF